MGGDRENDYRIGLVYPPRGHMHTCTGTSFHEEEWKEISENGGNTCIKHMNIRMCCVCVRVCVFVCACECVGVGVSQ